MSRPDLSAFTIGSRYGLNASAEEATALEIAGVLVDNGLDIDAFERFSERDGIGRNPVVRSAVEMARRWKMGGKP
jgi:hypothetical protein